MSHKIPVVLAFAVSIAAGCGGKKQAGPIDGATAQGMGNSMGSGAEASAGGFANPQGSGFAAAPCVTGSVAQNPTQLADSDGDGVPDTVTLTFTDCVNPSADATATETVNGTLTWSDPTASAADFDSLQTVNVTNHIQANAGPAHADITLTGSRSITGAAVVTSSFTMSDSTTFSGTGTANGETHSASEAKSWTVTYNSTGPWTLGTPLIPGTLSITGSQTDTYDGHHADMTVAAPSLTVTPSCATAITAGTLTASFDNDGTAATVTVTWTGCGSRTVVYTGP